MPVSSTHLVGHEVVLGHLLLHLRGLPPVAQGGVFYLFTLFRLADHFEGVVHVAFQRVHQVGVLLQLCLLYTSLFADVLRKGQTQEENTGEKQEKEHLQRQGEKATPKRTDDVVQESASPRNGLPIENLPEPLSVSYTHLDVYKRQIMKITKICIFTIVAFAAYACAKSDSVDTSSVTPETLVPVENDEIQCINGTLHFSSGEVCLNTLESLTSEESLHAFEKAHNFTSWRSFTDGMLDDICLLYTSRCV